MKGAVSVHLEILYVEDNPAEVYLLSEAVRRINPNLGLTVVGDGEAALAFLATTTGKPCVIVLDLGLPRIDGVEVFRVLKSSTEFRHVPVVVFAEDPGRKRIAETGETPDLFLKKPMDLTGYDEIARQIVDLCEEKTEEPSAAFA